MILYKTFRWTSARTWPRNGSFIWRAWSTSARFRTTWWCTCEGGWGWGCEREGEFPTWFQLLLRSVTSLLKGLIRQFRNHKITRCLVRCQFWPPWRWLLWLKIASVLLDSSWIVWVKYLKGCTEWSCLRLFFPHQKFCRVLLSVDRGFRSRLLLCVNLWITTCYIEHRLKKAKCFYYSRWPSMVSIVANVASWC